MNEVQLTPDWNSIEETVFTLSQDHLKEFFKGHQAETFYGFCIDCNSTYGGLCLAMNSLEALSREAEKCCRDHWFYAGKTLQQAEEELRWEIGAWSYFDLTNTETWHRAWQPIYDMISALTSEQPESVYDDGTDIEEVFMQMACRVLLRLDDAGLFQSIRKSADFRLLCLDHDEELWIGEARLEHVRHSVNDDLVG
jgi:hypothetical protein